MQCRPPNLRVRVKENTHKPPMFLLKLATLDSRSCAIHIYYSAKLHLATALKMGHIVWKVTLGCLVGN